MSRFVNLTWLIISAILFVARVAASGHNSSGKGKLRPVDQLHYLNDRPYYPLLHGNGNPHQPRQDQDIEHDALSCRGRCGTRNPNQNYPCQCNSPCVEHKDCCSDFKELCMSCRGRCFSKLAPDAPCQCNSKCPNFNNCCSDFGRCEKGGISNDELGAISEELLSLDVNNVAHLISVDLQGITSPGGPDKSPNPLLTFEIGAFDPPTISKLIRLHDNYYPAVGIQEDVTQAERREETEFLDAIMATPIMGRTEAFLTKKSLIPPGRFREIFRQIWFGLYSRSGNSLGSSGFEHVFLGELKKGVSGFHSWAFFGREERNNALNYKGHISKLSLGSKGMILSHSFDWRGNEKKISSMWIGTSPEFELGIYTLCWFARPNARCPISLSGNKINIQTYAISRDGQKFVASAYPDL